jgi:hypothetical protein
MIDPSLAKLLKICAVELEDLQADWAVSGATAMATHGYERATKDVDLFIAEEVREPFFARLADRGLTVEEVFPPVHFSLSPKRSRDPELHLDLLFPAPGVGCLGLVAARPGLVAGREMPVVPLQYLVAAKLLVDPEEDRERYDKDLQDLRALRLRGLIDPVRVRSVLEDVGDRGAIVRLHALLRGPE